MLHAILIDDEKNGLRSLELLITKFIKDVKIVSSTINSIEGVKMINDYRPDIVFLDINMPNLNGFELLDRLEYRNFHLIFTTAHREYALKAIKQQAIDYLLKPIGEEDLRKAIEKIKTKIADKQKPQDLSELLKSLDPKNIKIIIPGKNGVELVSPSDIIYIEANSNNCLVSLNTGEVVMVSKSLKDYEEQLCNGAMSFIRIHNSFIINVNHAIKYLKVDGGIVVMKDKKHIPISKSKKDEFLKLINFHPD